LNNNQINPKTIIEKTIIGQLIDHILLVIQSFLEFSERENDQCFAERIINSIIVKFLIGKKFIMKEWLIGIDEKDDPVYDDVTFTVRGYDNRFQSMDIEITDTTMSSFISEYRRGRICRP
jgi:hypothetical protein